MKYAFVITLLFAVIAIGFFIFQRTDEYEIVNYPSSGSTIVVFGDSLAQGVGARTEGGFVTILSERIGEPIINLGRGGDTTKLALARIDRVLETDPRIVMVLLGGNDYLSRVSKDETLLNLSAIIERIQSQGSVVILLGVRGGLLYDSYEKDYKKLARDLGAAYVPNVLNGMIGNSTYMDDIIHPNEAGHTLIADRVQLILEKLLR